MNYWKKYLILTKSILRKKIGQKKNWGIPQLLEIKQARDAWFLKNYLILTESEPRKKIGQKKIRASRNCLNSSRHEMPNSWKVISFWLSPISEKKSAKKNWTSRNCLNSSSHEMPNSWNLCHFDRVQTQKKNRPKKKLGIPQLLEFKQARDAQFLQNYRISTEFQLRKNFGQK